MEPVDAVRNYLEALDSYNPRRGRPQSLAKAQETYDAIAAKIKTTKDVNKRLDLSELQVRAKKELDRLRLVATFGDLEEAFVTHAADYANEKGLTWSAFREAGVPLKTLKKAGISRHGKRHFSLSKADASW